MAINDVIGGSGPVDFPIEKIRNEKDFYLEKLILVAYTGDEYDITNHRVVLKYHEDIFTSFITGTLELLDAIDYPQLMPIIGEERVIVQLARQDELRPGFIGERLKFNLRCYKISGQETKNEKVQTYTLHLVSDEFIKNTKTKFYRSWKSVKYSDMVGEIFEEKIKIKKDIVIESTKYLHDFSIGNISPFEFFNMIASRSISDEGNGEAYVFFETRESFYFVTLGYLFQKPTSQKFSFTPRGTMEPSKRAVKDMPIQIDASNVEHYNWHAKHDILRHLESGMYGQFLTTVDPVRQRFFYYDFNLKNEFESFKHLESNRFFTDKLDAVNEPKLAHTKLQETNIDHDIIPWIAGKEPHIRPFKLEEYSIRRTSQMNQINVFRNGIVVTGDPRRKAGQIVEFDIPQVRGDTSKERPQKNDRYFSGKYLILSISHTLTQEGYSQELELMKDSFQRSIEHTNPVKLYKPIY